MKLYDVFKIIEGQVAPVALSDELCSKYGNYDNSGIMLENEGEITGALFSLDFTPEAAEEAAQRGCNLIITHHPAIYHGIKRITPSDDLISRALVICIKNNIGVISMHLNFDSAPQGVDYYLMKGLGGVEAKSLLNPLSSGGYGRIYDIKPITFKEFVKRTLKNFETRRCFAYGDDDRIIKRVASFCGAGCDGQAAGLAINGGADVLVSSDIAHHMITGLFYNGVNVVQLTHYASEVYGFKKIAQSLAPSLGCSVCVYVDAQLM